MNDPLESELSMTRNIQFDPEYQSPILESVVSLNNFPVSQVDHLHPRPNEDVIF